MPAVRVLGTELWSREGWRTSGGGVERRLSGGTVEQVQLGTMGGSSIYVEVGVRIGGPPEGCAPAVQGGVPGDNDDVGGAGFPSEEGSVEGAGDERPHGAGAGGEVLLDPADEHGGLAGGGWEGNDAVEVRVGLGAMMEEMRPAKGMDVG